MITKRLLQSKLMKVTTKYTEINALEQENHKMYEEDKQIYLPQIALERFNSRKGVLQAEKDILRGICKDLVQDLKVMKQDHIKGKSKAKTKEYQEQLDHLIKLSSVSTNAQLKLIKFMKENNDIDSLNFLYIDDPQNAADTKINSAINKALKEIENDSVTKVLDKTINDFTNGINGSMMESTIKMYIEKDMFISLDDLKPFTATEMAVFKKDSEPSSEDMARYEITALEYAKRREGKEYDPIIDMV